MPFVYVPAHHRVCPSAACLGRTRRRSGRMPACRATQQDSDKAADSNGRQQEQGASRPEGASTDVRLIAKRTWQVCWCPVCQSSRHDLHVPAAAAGPNMLPCFWCAAPQRTPTSTCVMAAACINSVACQSHLNQHHTFARKAIAAAQRALSISLHPGRQQVCALHSPAGALAASIAHQAYQA